MKRNHQHFSGGEKIFKKLMLTGSLSEINLIYIQNTVLSKFRVKFNLCELNFTEIEITCVKCELAQHCQWNKAVGADPSLLQVNIH